MKYLIPFLLLTACSQPVCGPGYHEKEVPITYRGESRPVIMCMKDK